MLSSAKMHRIPGDARTGSAPVVAIIAIIAIIGSGADCTWSVVTVVAGAQSGKRSQRCL